MKIAILSMVFWSAFVGSAMASNYPTGPDQSLTPGEFCQKASEYRYAERIPYCRRDVSSDLKRQIIRTYDRTLGYRVGSMPRGDFKIDHYIPLCMGGSNRSVNLWPQHVSVYQKTDLLEQVLCEKIAAGRVLQSTAVDMIIRAKNNLDEVPQILSKAKAL